MWASMTFLAYMWATMMFWPVTLLSCSFLLSYLKRLKKVKLDNNSLNRCYGVKYCHVFLLVVCTMTRHAGLSKYSTTHKNMRRYFTPKQPIRYIYSSVRKCILLNSTIYDVEHWYNKVPGDWQNVFIITDIHYIRVLSIHFTVTWLKNMVCYTGVFVV